MANTKEVKNEEAQSLLDDEDISSNTEPSLLQTLLGLGAAFSWLFLVVTAVVSVQLLEKRIPDFELNTIRCVIPFTVQIIIVLFMRKIPLIPKGEVIGASCYILSLLLTSLFTYIAFTFLPAALVQSIDTSANLTSGLILFHFLLHEKVTVTNVLCSILCMVGVVLVLQPKPLFTPDHKTSIEENPWNETVLGYQSNLSSDNEFEELNNDYFVKSLVDVNNVLPYIYTCLGGIFLTTYFLTIRKYPYLSRNLFDICFWTFGVNSILSSILMLVFETPVLPMNWYDGLLAFIHGSAYGLNILVSTYALKYISGNVMNLIFSLNVVFFLVSQYTILSSVRPGHRNWIEGLGVGFVLMGSSLSTVREILKTTSCSLIK